MVLVRGQVQVRELVQVQLLELGQVQVRELVQEQQLGQVRVRELASLPVQILLLQVQDFPQLSVLPLAQQELMPLLQMF